MYESDPATVSGNVGSEAAIVQGCTGAAKGRMPESGLLHRKP